MIRKLPVEDFLKQFREEKPLLLDVRSPSEFKQAHIPGAISFPLLDDNQRKEVGITYKQKGKQAAVVKGFDLVGSTFGEFVRKVKKLKSSSKLGDDVPLLLYCWRGGLRSSIMAWVLKTAGYEIILLEDGYKAYRNRVLEILNTERKLVILGGKTGSGKTEMLQLLRKAGEQVICLETLANHRGSAFGAMGMNPQPRNEHFENLLAEEWEKTDERKTVWLENESQSIGSVVLPKKLFERMRSTPVVEMVIPKETRIQRIINEYGNFPVQDLTDNTKKIEQRLGGLKTQEAITALQEGNLEKWIEEILYYYDKTYEYGITNRAKGSVLQVELNESESAEIKVNKLIEASRGLLSEEKMYPMSEPLPPSPITAEEKESASIRLTQYSHGSGCGCKIAPSVLEEILKNEEGFHSFKNLLVGNEGNDDAAVYELNNEQCLISTVDFFMPIVDDAFDFGRIAATNSISDVYAMGGTPLLAVAILGWPVDKLSPAVARQVLAGARKVCSEINIPIAGGHSIDSPEPIFGLSVNGLVKKNHLKRNNTAQVGDFLFLTKPIGIGIIASAQKRGKAKEKDVAAAIEVMTQLNRIGEKLGTLDYIHAMTDVTGFGLLGHLIEMAEASGCSAILEYKSVPLIEGIEEYTNQFIFPDNIYRNWNSYEKKVTPLLGGAFGILCDPQTSGGLLIAVAPDSVDNFIAQVRDKNISSALKPIGRMTEKKDFVVEVNE